MGHSLLEEEKNHTKTQEETGFILPRRQKHVMLNTHCNTHLVAPIQWRLAATALDVTGAPEQKNARTIAQVLARLCARS